MDEVELREEILEILNNLDDSIDYENEDRLIDDRILDSFSIIALVGDLEEQYDIEIGAVNLVPENFNSVDAMVEMIQRLQE